MTTKPPPTVVKAPEDSMEAVAYAAVAGVPTTDQHDSDRLGYNVWRWLVHRKDPLDIAVKMSGSRLEIPLDEAVRRIRESLGKQGITDAG